MPSDPVMYANVEKKPAFGFVSVGAIDTDFRGACTGCDWRSEDVTHDEDEAQRWADAHVRDRHAKRS